MIDREKAIFITALEKKSSADAFWESTLSTENISEIGMAMGMCNIADDNLLWEESRRRMKSIMKIDCNVDSNDHKQLNDYRLFIIKVLKDMLKELNENT